MSLGDALSVVEDAEGAVAAVLEDGGDEDVVSSRVAGVAQELEEGILDAGDWRGAAAGTFGTREAGEARAEVAVGTLLYLATSLTRLSRMTVTLIWPGYSRSFSICLEIS
jgi:hypothetical protein